MTKIDRYILYLFLRTVLVCFCSIAGIFIVFHAFNSMDDLVEQGKVGGGLVPVMIRYYGPYMLMLFDWTGAIIALMAFLFTVGWLRRIGELTAILSSGISHGRLFRPMIIASLMIVLVQLANREFILPQYRNVLTMESEDIAGESEQPILAQYDKANRILIDGASLLPETRMIQEPNFELDGKYPGFGEALVARSAQWLDATENRPPVICSAASSFPRNRFDSLFWIAKSSDSYD